MSAILVHPDPRLRAKAAPVGVVGEGELAKLFSMTHDLRRERALGLAAPQVGWPVRAILLEVCELIALVDPVVKCVSREEETAVEGCLSLPGVKVRVRRPRRVLLEALVFRWDDLDRYGYVHNVERARARRRELYQAARGLESRCALHELDHLDGVLMTDRAIGGA